MVSKPWGGVICIKFVNWKLKNYRVCTPKFGNFFTIFSNYLNSGCKG